MPGMNSSHTESLSTLRIGWLPGFQLLKSPTTLMAVGMRCPDAEHHACLPGPLLDVRAKVAVRFTVIALLEQIHRQVRWTAVDLFLSRFHKQLLPVSGRRMAV